MKKKPSYNKSDRSAGNQSGSEKVTNKKSERSQNFTPKPPSSKRFKGAKLNSPVYSKPAVKPAEDIRLNKYLANAGICSRRKADGLIEQGFVQVNGNTVYEMGYRVQPSDIVTYQGEKVSFENKVYVLLNKPKDFITTTSDEKDRRTVMGLVRRAVTNERIYPVGRLDRNTTGLLLLTNDGDLTQYLSHPSSEIVKVYQVELDKPITRSDLETIRNEGVELEDGRVYVDEIDITTPQVDYRFVGVAIHSGKNRVVRRIFEHFGYEIKTLDRVLYAGLTKKDLPRGKWRYLTEKELIFLKHLRSGHQKRSKK